MTMETYKDNKQPIARERSIYLCFCAATRYRLFID